MSACTWTRYDLKGAPGSTLKDATVRATGRAIGKIALPSSYDTGGSVCNVSADLKNVCLGGHVIARLGSATLDLRAEFIPTATTYASATLKVRMMVPSSGLEVASTTDLHADELLVELIGA